MSTATDVDISLFTQIVEDLSVPCEYTSCEAAAEVILEAVCPCGTKAEFLLCLMHTTVLLTRWNNAGTLKDSMRGGCKKAYPPDTFRLTVTPLNHDHKEAS